MKIIVTGATGHIGSYIARDLGIKFPNAKIIMIDNLMTQRFSSLFGLPNNVKYSFIEGDVSQINLNPIFRGADVVIHLAAITDAAGSFDRAEELEENNFKSTVAVAKACIKSNSSLIAISSTSVYGTQKDLVDENCSQSELQPQSPYASTKLKEEELIRDLSISSDLKSIHCRFGTIFGASKGMRFHTAVNKFCWQACMGLPISVWSTAYDQKRPYLDLLDASRAIEHIIKNNIFDGQIYNVLTQNSTVREVVEIINSFVPNLSIEFVETRIMNQLSYEVLTEKFKSTNFSYTGNLSRGIEETISLLKNANQLK